MIQRVAIITGAGNGIGAATAVRLSWDGLAVAVVDKDREAGERTAQEITESGCPAVAVPADVTDPAQIRAAVDQVTAQLGPPTVLINNAGLTSDRPFAEMTAMDWDLVLELNLHAPFLMSQAVLPYLRQQRWGRIVNVSSLAAQGTTHQANYAAAKAGVQGLTRALAVELGPEGITVNAVAPGYIVTGMSRTSAARHGAQLASLQRVAAARTPLRRVGRPEDVAEAIAFLASEESGFITGQVLPVTGGLTV
ncbi:SDR family NAD(P)-dependent oxidoreductase [Streptomyces sp. NPDC052396]|uniref:SDR family NAD(P)-dependent oxidoreductase n=1 Tax=Streptomyces sp. NPDC052396 TaxID=3365689 RepID=UPI0037D87633